MSSSGRGYAPVAPRQPASPLRTTPEEPSALPAVSALVLAIVLNFLVLSKLDIPVVRPVLGFWFLLVFPAYLIFTTSVWRGCHPPERLGYSVGSALFILMVTGLAVNGVLPL